MHKAQYRTSQLEILHDSQLLPLNPDGQEHVRPSELHVPG